MAQDIDYHFKYLYDCTLKKDFKLTITLKHLGLGINVQKLQYVCAQLRLA